MHEYAAYGLTIDSEFRLPELPTTEADDPDVVVRETSLTPVDPARAAVDADRRVVAAPGCCRLSYEGVGTFRIEDGRRILVDPDTPSTASTMVFRRLLEGQVLGVLCHQRGDLVLHGSAVAVDGGAAVFLGVSGAGKSTTAAACYRDGFSLYDDVVVIRFPDDRPTVVPGVPQLKLEPETATTLGLDAERAAGIDEVSEKAYHELDRAALATPRPLQCCYVLTEDDSTAVGPVPSQDQLLQLVTSTYTAGLLADTDAMHTNFRQCSRVAETTRIRTLSRPTDLDALPDVVETVRRDLATARRVK